MCWPASNLWAPDQPGAGLGIGGGRAGGGGICRWRRRPGTCPRPRGRVQGDAEHSRHPCFVPGPADEDTAKRTEACPACGGSLWYYAQSPTYPGWRPATPPYGHLPHRADSGCRPQ